MQAFNISHLCFGRDMTAELLEVNYLVDEKKL
jgi:hypothetical protein